MPSYPNLDRGFQPPSGPSRIVDLEGADRRPREKEAAMRTRVMGAALSAILLVDDSSHDDN
jgi:hypothetical protein